MAIYTLYSEICKTLDIVLGAALDIPITRYFNDNFQNMETTRIPFRLIQEYILLILRICWFNFYFSVIYWAIKILLRCKNLVTVVLWEMAGKLQANISSCGKGQV